MAGAVNRPISRCNKTEKKAAPRGRGQSNREEVNRDNQHGLPGITHVD
jgi:hypothetical protein